MMTDEQQKRLTAQRRPHGDRAEYFADGTPISDLYDKPHSIVAYTVPEPDARRLAACWNACDGWPTESLEAFAADPSSPSMPKALTDSANREIALRERGERLAAALREAQRALELAHDYEGHSFKFEECEYRICKMARSTALEGWEEVRKRTDMTPQEDTRQKFRHGDWKMTLEECRANDGHCWRWPGDDGKGYATYDGAPNIRWCKHCGYQQVQRPARWEDYRS